MPTQITLAEAADAEAIFTLVAGQHLPLDGLREHLATTLVAHEGAPVVGSAALEFYADGALLRSVAVAAGRQGHGLGSELTRAALTLAEQRHAPAVYLLTTTAERFFPKFGFERIQRDEVPPGVKTSVEFTSACPSSAVVMRKELSPEACE